MVKLSDYLKRHAEATPKHIALVCGTEQVDYARLYERVKDESLVWASHEHRAVVVKASQTISFIVTYLAIQMAGKTVVPLENTIPDARVDDIRRIVEGSVIPENISDILFTTGTTGRQKGVMISHEAILANAENLIEAQGFHSDTVFVISGPLNHIGSLSKVWPVIRLGGTLRITDGVKDMETFLAAFDASSTHFATFLVPASIRMLIQFSAERLEALSGRIEFIETGAAPISQSDMWRLRQLLPGTRLYNTYASTETGIVSTYDFSSHDCIPGLLGKPMKHATVWITETGMVACKGAMLMSGYIGDPELTRSVLREGIVYTSDMGYMDADGCLHLGGRTDDIINIGGYKVSPVEVENAVMGYPGIKECICICVGHPVVGPVLKLLYVRSEEEEFNQKSLIRFLKDNLEPYKVPFSYQSVEKIERTYNGKLNRKFYKDCF